MTDKDKLKEEAKKYIELIYMSGRNDNMKSLDRLIEIIFMYIDMEIADHELNCKHN